MALNCRRTGPVGEIGEPSTQHVMEMLSKDDKDGVCYHQLVIGDCNYEARGGTDAVQAKKAKKAAAQEKARSMEEMFQKILEELKANREEMKANREEMKATREDMKVLMARTVPVPGDVTGYCQQHQHLWLQVLQHCLRNSEILRI